MVEYEGGGLVAHSVLWSGPRALVRPPCFGPAPRFGPAPVLWSGPRGLVWPPWFGLFVRVQASGAEGGRVVGGREAEGLEGGRVVGGREAEGHEGGRVVGRREAEGHEGGPTRRKGAVG